MKKKLSVLLMGAILAAAPMLSQAQLSLANGSTVTIGTTFTYNGLDFKLVAPPDPNAGTESQIEKNQENAAFDALVAANLWFTFNGNTYSFEQAIKDSLFAVNKVPFDLGLGVVLGAGAIAAAKRARNRRKLQESVV